ncbi:MAG: GTPase HflX [Candidatus Cloacimonetes bacterium]|jgi:GTP-binding protein HflX|nr:GTPase HflX [Candidatus Cloacimonadota bacterium]MCB5287978.1 GTPase HflX [Candidatus Cloacimonadota bacterium]MCK9185100.1 GTPase HflX [Candidatus Cloacimonadota bacterium]MCK9584324.1 GTPase HflX [Candidatus Cloacimonadota bacterium]MDY0230300.1 GTPase HflX [Candidatus Cloacimonadaceae bacterium]
MQNEEYLDEQQLEEEESWDELQKDEKCAFIAAIVTSRDNESEAHAALDELERLADTAGIAILGRYTQRRTQPERSSYFGKGFLEEISIQMHQAGADMLIVNAELSSIQGRNIENTFQIKVIDRTEVILSIFHDHARSKEAKLQVKLAELQYQLPRLRRLWGHFDQERGSARSAGGAASRGMGEKQIEVDKRLIRQQIGKINKSINQITAQKETQRKQRDNSKKICIVGYTNAGKSTLFNLLTDAGVLVEDRLFATLDSTSRQLKLSTGTPAIISDTVGFISNLPHHLIASFRATLMEAVDADLLLHLVDISDERHEYYVGQVDEVLSSIGASEIPQIIVLNKKDLVDNSLSKMLSKYYENAVAISAAQNLGIEELLLKIEELLMENRLYHLRLPYTQNALVSRLHEIGKITQEDYKDDGIYLSVILGAADRYLIQEYVIPQ